MNGQLRNESFVLFTTKAKILEKVLQHVYKRNSISLCPVEQKRKAIIEFNTSIPLEQMVDKGLERFIVIESIADDKIKGHTVDEITVVIYYTSKNV